jgi:hypothetical protein
MGPSTANHFLRRARDAGPDEAMRASGHMKTLNKKAIHRRLTSHLLRPDTVR